MEMATHHPLLLALGAGLLSWLSISLGAAGIFARREYSRRTLDVMLGLAAGMMLGATFWALLTPAVQQAAGMGKLAFAPVAFGLLLGAGFLRLFDMILPHLHISTDTTEGVGTAWKRSVLLTLAMALHHFPEGLAMGVGCGAAGVEQNAASLSAAFVLTMSMLLQNIPEGFVVATALRAEGLSARRACLYGALTGCTTPLGALTGALGAGAAAQMLPISLAFAAGAMLFVIVEDVIPEAQASGNTNAATLALIGGVILVMTLDSLL